MARYIGAAGRVGERGSAGQHLPDHCFADITVFELAARRHQITGALRKTRDRKIGAARVA
jgi:hypothetical protein